MESNQKDYKYLSLALEMAFKSWGKTSPNPAVGAVIVRNNKIISKGSTSPYGGDHAEIVALKKAKTDLKGAELYVSLEPCSHYGQTPPCTEAIIKSGISKVHLPILDPNPKVSGRGIKKLKQAGIEINLIKDLSKAAYDLIRPFHKYITQKKPYIIHKNALTLDGQTATIKGDSKWISSSFSRYLVHKLRAKVDAILVGKTTFEKDQPRLNVRLKSFKQEVAGYFKQNPQLSGYDNFFLKSLLKEKNPLPKDPLKVIIGLPKINSNYNNFFQDDNYLILAPKTEIKLAKKKNTSLNIIPLQNRSLQGQIKEILTILAERGIMTILLEGGSKLSSSFLENQSLDQILWFMAPKILGPGLNPFRSLKPKNKIVDSLNLYDISSILIKNDLLYNAYTKKN